jgi:L,D-peptidoglycan transpeptidase YkuD (ErfK/YbiS/YcfS/YnhG family)
MPRRTNAAAVLALAATLILPASAHAASPRPVGHLLVTRLIGVGDARQVISVTAARYGSTHATIRAFAKHSSGWVQVAGPWSAWIGNSGFAPPGHKREGDGRTPSGSYHFSFFFGVDPDPGVRFAWRHASRHDFWDDDSSSSHYNEWVNALRYSAGRSPEPMHVQPSYDDGAAIAYNTARTPGLGSAIFLHVTHHSATSGCVALPRPQLRRLLRWLDPRDHPRIIMGRTATVTR